MGKKDQGKGMRKIVTEMVVQKMIRKIRASSVIKKLVCHTKLDAIAGAKLHKYAKLG